MDLIEWATHYIDYANSFKKDLLSKNIQGKNIICEYKVKGKVTYLIREEINEDVLKELTGTNSFIVTLNKKDNAKYMLEKLRATTQKRDHQDLG